MMKIYFERLFQVKLGNIWERSSTPEIAPRRDTSGSNNNCLETRNGCF